VVDAQPFPAQQDQHAPAAEAPTLPCERARPLPMRAFKASDGLSLHSGRFLATRSFKAALSSIASANSFFSSVSFKRL
jgi:hypothetical protein